MISECALRDLNLRCQKPKFEEMLQPGSPAPKITLPDAEGNLVSLSDFYGKKSLVVYFYPKNETHGCTKEACAFRDSYEAFTDAGAEVVGISMDSVESHQQFIQNRKLPFVLLSDRDGKAHSAFDVGTKLFGLWRNRVTFVIDKQGIIRNAFQSQINIDGHLQAALKTIMELDQ